MLDLSILDQFDPYINKRNSDGSMPKERFKPDTPPEIIEAYKKAQEELNRRYADGIKRGVIY